MTPSTSFFCTRLYASTFLIVEDDSYGERPHIYVKIYPQVILISDTGCNSARREGVTVTSLRHYLEAFRSPANGDSPLNLHGAKPYLILCTHCHYDHILGIPPFLLPSSAAPPEPAPAPAPVTPRTTTTILASAHSKSFLQHDLPTHSLCRFLHVPTPSYPISHWARHLEFLSYTPPPPSSHPFVPEQSQGQGEGLLESPRSLLAPAPTPIPLRIQLLHIPGHTPDSLAWYDMDAHHLFIGDMFYARKRSTHGSGGGAFPFPFPISSPVPRVAVPGPTVAREVEEEAGAPLSGLAGDEDGDEDEDEDAAIIFPSEGDWVDYMSSLDLLLSFVRHQNCALERDYRLLSHQQREQEHEQEKQEQEQEQQQQKQQRKHGSGAAHTRRPSRDPPPPPRVLLGSGHVTAAGDAEDMAVEVQALFWRIIRGELESRRSEVKRGEVFDYWCEGEEARYSVQAPRRLVEEAKRHFGEGEGAGAGEGRIVVWDSISD